MAVLRIDIEGNPKSIPYKSFLEVATNSLAVLSDLDRAFSSRYDGALEWYMNDLARNGVLRLEVYSRVKNVRHRELPDVGKDVATSFVRGFDTLEHLGRSPEFLTAQGMNRARKMTEMLGRNGGANKLIASVPDTDTETDITKTSNLNLRKLLPEAYRSFGSIEGKLEGISVHNKLDVIVYEAVHDKAVTCHIANADLLGKIKDALGSRVQITGEISRNARSEPRKVTVIRSEDFKIFGSDLKVLPFRRLAGSDPDFTGDLSTGDFIKSVRG